MICRVKDVARALFVTPRTVRRWVSQGMLKPRGYRRVGGNALEMIFTSVEIDEFMNNYLIAPGDLGKPSMNPDERAAQVNRLIGTLRVFAGKATAARTAKRLRVKTG
jgi:hypothetical protein